VFFVFCTALCFCVLYRAVFFVFMVLPFQATSNQNKSYEMTAGVVQHAKRASERHTQNMGHFLSGELLLETWTFPLFAAAAEFLRTEVPEQWHHSSLTLEVAGSNIDPEYTALARV
jgi:hypothetical protein